MVRATSLRSPLPHVSLAGEVSGAFADLGILVPIEATLIAVNGLNPTTTLLGVGLAYIVAGRYFAIPMPVQPLKAFAAVAIVNHASPEVIAAGALWMSLVLAALAATGLVSRLADWVPVGVVRGVQLGLGLLLLKNSWDFVIARPFSITGHSVSVGLAGQQVSWSLPVALVAAVVLLAFLRSRRVPAALILLVGGGLVGLAVMPDRPSLLSWGPAPWTPHFPAQNDFLIALPLLVIPQLPLTLANSVIATSDAATHYFGERARRATPRAVSMSIALGNLWAGLSGGLPMCHGCGGLTAHYRLGARSPLATTIIGALLVAVGLLLGAGALQVRSVVPYAVYGVLLGYVGFEHLRLGWAWPDRSAAIVALLTAAAAMLADGNLAVGAGLGLVASGLMWVLRFLWRGRPAVV